MAREPETKSIGRFFVALIQGALAYVCWSEVPEALGPRGSCFHACVMIGLGLLWTASTFWALTGRKGSG